MEQKGGALGRQKDKLWRIGTAYLTTAIFVIGKDYWIRVSIRRSVDYADDVIVYGHINMVADAHGDDERG